MRFGTFDSEILPPAHIGECRKLCVTCRDREIARWRFIDSFANSICVSGKVHWHRLSVYLPNTCDLYFSKSRNHTQLAPVNLACRIYSLLSLFEKQWIIIEIGLKFASWRKVIIIGDRSLWLRRILIRNPSKSWSRDTRSNQDKILSPCDHYHNYACRQLKVWVDITNYWILMTVQSNTDTFVIKPTRSKIYIDQEAGRHSGNTCY